MFFVSKLTVGAPRASSKDRTGGMPVGLTNLYNLRLKRAANSQTIEKSSGKQWFSIKMAKNLSNLGWQPRPERRKQPKISEKVVFWHYLA